MKQFFESYGAVALGILALLVLIAMVTPVGNIVKTSLQGTAHKFGSSISSQTDTMTSDMEKMLENSMYVSEYAKEVLSKQRLYDAGEQNLTADDIVTINGVECYVLEATATTAKLITKDIYAAPFDSGGHNSEDVEGYVGTGAFADRTYDYKYSTLKTWMDDFYSNELGSNNRILLSTVQYIINPNYPYSGTINSIEQYVFPLESTSYANKFGWNDGEKLKNYFWTLYGYKYLDSDGIYKCAANHIGNNNNGNSADVQLTNIGARPVFWITLE